MSEPVLRNAAGRPAFSDPDQVRSTTLNIRTTPRLQASLRDLSESNGRSMSDQVRRIITNVIRHRGKEVNVDSLL